MGFRTNGTITRVVDIGVTAYGRIPDGVPSLVEGGGSGVFLHPYFGNRLVVIEVATLTNEW